MELKIIGVKQDLLTGAFTLKFIPRRSRKAEKELQKMMQNQGKYMSLELNNEKRSNKANAYMWELMGKIAEVLGTSTEEAYISHIKQYGVSYIGNYKSLEEAKMAVAAHDSLGKGWTHEVLDTYPDGSVALIMYCGSSIYNKEQMKRLIDGVVSSCEELEIETKEQAYIDSLIDSMPTGRRDKND